MFRSKRGSYIVEATILYPMIIVISVMMILICVFFYMNIEHTYEMSHKCRTEAGLESGTVLYNSNDHQTNNINCEIKLDGLIKKVRATESKTIKNKLIFRYSHNSDYAIERSAINEAGIIWNKDIVSDVIK